jgi:predicted nucleotidyltransferase
MPALNQVSIHSRYPHLENAPQSLERAVDLLKTLPDICAIFLLGSAARGELSMLRHERGEVELFSDYEFLVVTTKRISPQNRKIFQNQLMSLEKHIGNPNPLFHIDVLFRERHRVSTLPQTIFAYELKQNGVNLYGRDVRHEMPEVTIRNLDFRNTNEILFKRLCAILLHLPRRFLLGGTSHAERRVTGYVLSRNALDLTTVLLPHEGILLPTYRQRVEKLCAAYPELGFFTLFGPELPSFLETCLSKRLNLDFTNVDLHDWYRQTIRYLELAIQYAAFKAGCAGAPLPACSGRIFNEWPISWGEWYNLVRLMLQHLRKQHAVYRWLMSSKKGWSTLGLLSMHKALIAWQKGDSDEADLHLQASRTALSQLTLTDIELEPGSFPLQWLSLRKRWADFCCEYFLLGNPRYRQRFSTITEWQRD